MNRNDELIRVLKKALDLLEDSVYYVAGDKDYHQTIRAGWKAIDKASKITETI